MSGSVGKNGFEVAGVYGFGPAENEFANGVLVSHQLCILALGGAAGWHEDVARAGEQDGHHRHHSEYRGHRVTPLRPG
jgi:hypothetical protein